jgi:hypothetical protein
MTYPKPCPVCGSTDFAVEFNQAEPGITACLVCMGCDENIDTRGRDSKPCKNEEEAEEAATLVWNECGPVQGGG